MNHFSSLCLNAALVDHRPWPISYSEHSRWCSSGTQVCMQSRCLDRLGLFCCHRRDCSGQQHKRGQRRHIQHRPNTPDRRWPHRWALHSGTGRYRRIQRIRPSHRTEDARQGNRYCPLRPRGYTLRTSGCRSLSRRPVRCNRCHPRRPHNDPHRRQRPPCLHMTRHRHMADRSRRSAVQRKWVSRRHNHDWSRLARTTSSRLKIAIGRVWKVLSALVIESALAT